MARKEAKKYKALYFDLRIKDLAEYYSKTNPKGAYAKISRFLAKHNFSHKHEIITFVEYGGVFAE